MPNKYPLSYHPSHSFTQSFGIHLINSLSDHLLKGITILFKAPNPCRQQISRHLALVHLVPECCLIEIHFLDVQFLGVLCAQFHWNISVRVLQLV